MFKRRKKLSNPSRQNPLRRALRTEQLEKRQLLAGDIGSHNEALPQDVNADGSVTAIDALIAMNHLKETRDSNSLAERAVGVTGASIRGLGGAVIVRPQATDVDNSGAITARDILMIINFMRMQQLNGGAPSGSPASPPVETPPPSTETPAETPPVESPQEQPTNETPTEPSTETPSEPTVATPPPTPVPQPANCFTARCLINGGSLPTRSANPPSPPPPPASTTPPPSEPATTANPPAPVVSPAPVVNALPADLIYTDFPKDSSVDTEFSATFNEAFQMNAANEIAEDEVDTLLERASAATRSNDAIIAVVDRNGTILGVRVESGVSTSLTSDPEKLAFAIDGAVAKARTAAFFSSNSAPLTSRTIRSLSQSTITQREVESMPSEDSDLRFKGPGLVAPIGVGGKFPPEVNFTPQVDLFAIEHQSRDSQIHAGANGIKGDGDDFALRTRFNADPAFIPTNAEDFFQTWPEAYGIQAGTDLAANSRGIATQPGGVPLYKLTTDSNGDLVFGNGPVSKSINLVGGIGVFFPGEDGYASYEQGFVHGVNQTEKARTNAPRVLEAEFAALIAAAGNRIVVGDSNFGRDISFFNNRLAALPNYVIPNGRIDLVGITLEIFGPNPTRANRKAGIDTLLSVGRANFGGIGFESGSLQPVEPGGDTLLDGKPVPQEWLVAPHDSSVNPELTADVVEQIIVNGITAADKVRAAIRLDVDNGFAPGPRTRMVLSVADTSGEVLGLFRMPDATIFSIDVAVAKARNTAYYADPTPGVLQDEDRLDFDGDGVFEATSKSLRNRLGDTIPVGTAFTNRTFRFVVEPRFPSGVEINASRAAIAALQNDEDLDLCEQNRSICLQVAPQSILRLPGINPVTAENLVDDDPLPFDVYGSAQNAFSVLAFDSFVPTRNFRDLGDATVTIQGDGTAEPLANQNGIVFFPGSTPLYARGGSEALTGGFGVSGDGVDQDDVVTVAGQEGFGPRDEIRVDQYTLAGVRLPFQKFNRNPFGS